MTGSSLLTQISAIALRSTLRTARQPAVLVSAILFPMMFFSVNAYGLDAATSIPGFPADSYLDFAFAFPLVQASLFGSITAGADLARDIESGFFDRLSLTPMRPVALLAGMLAGVVALGIVQGDQHGFAAGQWLQAVPPYTPSSGASCCSPCSWPWGSGGSGRYWLCGPARWRRLRVRSRSFS